MTEMITVTGTVTEEPVLEFPTPGYEELAELQFTIQDPDGNEHPVSFTHNPLADGTPQIRHGQTLRVSGYHHEDVFIDMESYQTLHGTDHRR